MCQIGRLIISMRKDQIEIRNYKAEIQKTMEQTSVSLTKEQREWNKQLNHHIDKYSYLRDWSELASWLSKLKFLVHDYKGNVLDISALLKKLTTSLNGSLPVALHEATLEIFELLFAKNMIRESLGMACLGIFSFFGIANMKNKQKVIEIFIKHFPPYKQQLRVLATGLMITVLPSLTQMHEQLVKDINFLLELLGREQVFGHSLLVESIWIAIMRSSPCRVAGLKYFSQKLGRGFQEDQNDEQDTFWNDNEDNTSGFRPSLNNEEQMMVEEQTQRYKGTSLNKIQQIEMYCPHLETVVINALIACVSDSNSLAIKASLDFLYKYLPLRSDILSHSSKIKLSKPIIWLLGKRDMSVTRKINLWLFGKPNIENKFDISRNHLEYITHAVSTFLRESNDDSAEPLKIVINLYNEHEQLAALTLEVLTKDIMDYALRHQENQQVQKLLQRFIDRVKGQLNILSKSLGNYLLKNVQDGEFKEANKTLHLTLLLIHKILKPAEAKQLVFPILKVIMMSYQKTLWADHDYMRTALEVALDMTDRHRDIFIEIGSTYKNDQTLKEHIELYAYLITKLRQNKDHQQSFEQDLLSLNRLQVKIHQLFDVYEQKWVPMLIEAIELKNPQYFLAPIDVIGQGLQREGRLRDELMAKSEQKKNNYIERSIYKLWNIISLGHLQGRAVSLLLKLCKYFPHFFTQVLKKEFESSNEMCIIKFSLFWKLSPKYPTILSQEHLAQILKEGLFKMLDYLDNGNPLIKYNTNIWVNESFPYFHRVLDPLLEIMLKPKDFWYQTPKGQYIYAINPDNDKLLNTLKQLHSVLKHTTLKFYPFAVKPITASIKPYYQIFTGNVSDPQNQKEISYIEVIFEIITRFTLSKYICIQNPGIDLVSCEILQTVLRHINDPQLCNHLLKNNSQQILLALHFATTNQEHLLQIQLLNLLKIVFFESGLRRSEDNKFMKNLISSPLFVNTILEGLDTTFPYIKERFVEFISFSIPLFLEYHASCSELISKILNLYTTKIMVINSKKMEAKENRDIEISKKNVEILVLLVGVKQLLSYFLNLEIKQFEKEKSQTETDSGVFSLYSWKSYVSLKLQRKVLESSRARKCAQEIAKQISNQLYHLLLTMTFCWTLSDLAPHYKLDNYGMRQFLYQDFHSFNKQLYLTISKYETEETVETFIINLMRVLINKYPREVMNSMIHNWATAPNVQTKLKITEILNMSSLPIELFYNILGDALENKQQKKRKSNQLQILATNQTSLINFCQVFTHYNFQNFSVFQAANLINVWLAFMKFLRTFEHSRNVLTLFALVELVDLFVKKNNPKQILKEERLKKDMLYLTSQIVEFINVCGGKTKIPKPSEPLPYSMFLPLPTSLVELRSSSTEEGKASWLVFDNVSPDKCQETVRMEGMCILKRVGYSLLQVFYGDSEASLVRRVRELLSTMLSMVEDKSLHSQLIEAASQVVLSTLEKKHIFLKQFKNDVLHIFNKDDFFIVSSRTLHCWVKIIDMIIDSNKDHDIFSEYLDKVSLVSSIFSSYSLETKKKIKSFERICFILYSGKKDKYIDKTYQLIDKIIEVTKNNEAPQPVLILIFFCIRVLILRVTPEKLTKLLSNVWQLIMFLLISIFKKSDIEKDKNELNLVWAALKLIEMVSIMEMNEFHPHQWIFFYDFVGMKFRVDANTSPLEFKGQPLIHRFHPYVQPFRGQVLNESHQRHLIIKQDKIEDLQILRTKALFLSRYLIASNQNKMKFDMQEIEELIEKDFLNLDEFIFKFK